MKLGTLELMVILAVVVIIFGPTQIPKLTKMFGKSVKGFREGIGADNDGSDSNANANANANANMKVSADAEEKKA